MKVGTVVVLDAMSKRADFGFNLQKVRGHEHRVRGNGYDVGKVGVDLQLQKVHIPPSYYNYCSI